MEPRKFGRYEIKSELGAGGMATVYLAHDPRFRRDVALKVLPQAYLHDAAFRARFEREAQTIAALEHPAIVSVYDFGEQDGQPYLVMAYMPGGSLADRLQQGPLDPAGALKLMERIAPALDQAHRKGIVHRDLKPANILFDRYGNAFISDFGIVKVSQATSSLTGDALIGTPAYMSPEQARGNAPVDGRSDLYALGAILFEVLTGQSPYRADTPMGVLIKHVMEPVPRILNVKPDLPVGIEAVINQAMAKNPAERYATAGQMVSALAAAVQDTPAGTKPAAPSYDPTMVEQPPAGPTAASPPQIHSPAAQRERRVPLWVLIVGALFILGAVIGVVLAVVALPLLLGEEPTPVAGGGVTATIATAGDDTATPAAPTATEAAATEASPTDLPVVANPATPTDTPRPEPTLTPSPLPPPTRTPTPRPLNGPIVFDAIRGVPSEIYVMAPDGGSPTRLTDNDFQDDEADFSSDGRFIAYESRPAGQWQIMIMGRDGSNPRQLVPGRQPDWSPDDRFIAYESEQQQLYIVEVASGDVRQLTDGGSNRAPSWAPDGQRLVFMSEIGSVWQLVILNLDNGAQRQITRGGDDKRFPVWSPDGTLIAYNTVVGSAPDHIWTVEPSGDNPRRLTTEGQNGRPGWSPDSRFILFNSNRSGRWLIWRINRDGTDPLALTTLGDDQRPDWGVR